MKKKTILIFLFVVSIFFLDSRGVNADTYSHAWLGDFSFSSGTSLKIGPAYGIKFNSTVTAEDSQDFNFTNANWHFNASANFIVLTGLYFFESSDYTSISCSNFISDADGYVWCGRYDGLDNYIGSINVSILYSNNSRASCTLSNIEDGFFTATCPVISGANNISNITVRFWNSQKYTSNDVFIGFSKDILYVISTSQQITSQLEESNKTQQEISNSINNSDTTEASSQASSFFSGFEDNSHGLTAIVTAPLNLIKSITSSTCTPLGFTAPFVNQEITLPCMKEIYEEHFPTFLTLYQTITFGIVAYWVCVNILATVRGFKNPDSDRIEVLDL